MWKQWRKFIEEQLFEHLIVFASLIEHVLIFKIIRLKNCKHKFDATALALEKLDFPIFESMIKSTFHLFHNFIETSLHTGKIVFKCNLVETN